MKEIKLVELYMRKGESVYNILQEIDKAMEATCDGVVRIEVMGYVKDKVANLPDREGT